MSSPLVAAAALPFTTMPGNMPPPGKPLVELDEVEMATVADWPTFTLAMSVSSKPRSTMKRPVLVSEMSAELPELLSSEPCGL